MSCSLTWPAWPSKVLSPRAGQCTCPDQDQSEWQIEWQRVLVRAGLGLVGAGLCLCLGWSGALTWGDGTVE